MITVNRAVCCYCGACVATCPHVQIELVDTFLEIHEGCLLCAICVNICPVGALGVSHEEV